MKVGDNVLWELKRSSQGHRYNADKYHGRGVLTKVSPALGNCPLTFEVDTYRAGVLFEDEVKLDCRRKRG
jgi:hypothetical protein